MVSFFASALPLLYLAIFGAVPPGFSAHLLLFTFLSGALSHITEDSFIVLGLSLAVTVLIALVNVTRRSLKKLLPLLVTASAIIALPGTPLAAIAALAYLLLLLLHKDCTSLFTALIAALLLSSEISKMYYLSTPVWLLTSLILSACAVLLNRKPH